MPRFVVLSIPVFFFFHLPRCLPFPIIRAPLILVVRSSKETIGWRKFSLQACRQKLTRVSVFLTFAEINASNVERRRRRASRVPMVLIKTDFIKSSWQRARNAAKVTSNTKKFFQTYTRVNASGKIYIDTRIIEKFFITLKMIFIRVKQKQRQKVNARKYFFFFLLKVK